MDNAIVLSRLNLIPEIDENTPLVVLEEISLCHKIPYDEMFVDNVRNKPIGIVHEPVQNNEWSIIAQYINPNETWPIPELQDAYNFIKDWANHIDRRPHNDFTFGLQTPSDPARFNACILYSICAANNVKTHYDTTLYQLATLCNMLIRPDSYSRNIIYNTINNIPKEDLMQLYVAATGLMDYSPDQVSDVNRDYLALEDSVSAFDSKQMLRMRVRPQSYADAIVLAALNFSIDLSGMLDPIVEYAQLYKDPDNYIPSDPHLQSLVKSNPHLISTTETFNPLLPSELYDENVLAKMARTEGYTDADLRQDSAYTLLQMAYMSSTFYHGVQPGMKNTETPFMLDIVEELDSNLIVCFGVQGAHGTMIAFRYTELGELFKHHRNFVNPMVEDDIFPHIAITKLKNLCKMVRAGDTQAVIDERNMVYEAIINTELFTDETQAKARELFEIHEQATPEKKIIIEDAINKLFWLSMYMRGWSGDGEYPIIRAPVDNQVFVDLNVTKALHAFESACKDLEEIGEIILELPLLKYKAGGFRPIMSDDSRTIADRIAIVKAGDTHDNYDSCIRLSSNLFAMSSYRYMDILGIPVPFQVERLREIS